MFSRFFNSRWSWKGYLFVMPCSLLLFLALGRASIAIGALFLCAVVSRLNDIGWRRWHCIWLGAWALFAKLVLSGAMQDGQLTVAERGAVGIVELPLFLLLIALAFIPGQKDDNKFGPKPISMRKAFFDFRDKREKLKNALKPAQDYVQAFTANRPEQEALRTKINEQNERMQELFKEYRFYVDQYGYENAAAKRELYDNAQADLLATLAQSKAISDRIAPKLEALKKSWEGPSQSNELPYSASNP